MQRRDALKLIAAGLLADRLEAVNGHLVQLASAPETYHLQFFLPGQDETVSALAETIIPADNHSAGARAAKVNLFIDLMVANSERGVQENWKRGLAAFDAEAQHFYGSPFARLTASQQNELMKVAARNEGAAATPLEHFFAALKLMTLNGYYTSPTGIHSDLQYKGNTALPNYYGCTHPEHLT
jgi:hypothetical protein